MKPLDTIIDSAFKLAGEVVAEKIVEKIRIQKEQRTIIDRINSEYYCLTDKFLDPALTTYVTNAVSEWWEINQRYGERAGYKCITLRLEEAKGKFTLEPSVVNYLDQKIVEFKEKAKP